MTDYIIRATAANNQIRAFACTTKQTVEEARRIHNTTPVATAALGRLLSAGVMMGAMLKNEKDLITLQIKGDGPIGGVLVTCDSQARIKGYVNNAFVDIPLKENGKLDVSGAIGSGLLTVIMDLGLKEPYSGQIKLISGEIAEDIAYYYANSEQVPSVVALGVLVDKDYSVKQSGGFIIQLMPDAEETIIEQLEENLKNISSITNLLEEGNTPEEILGIMLKGLEMVINDKMDTSYYCNCSRERVEKALISIGKKDLLELVEEGEEVKLNCHFCNTEFGFSVDEITKLLAQF
jgi:molecular chaperone Hsp33